MGTILCFATTNAMASKAELLALVRLAFELALNKYDTGRELTDEDEVMLEDFVFKSFHIESLPRTISEAPSIRRSAQQT